MAPSLYSPCTNSCTPPPAHDCFHLPVTGSIKLMLLPLLAALFDVQFSKIAQPPAIRCITLWPATTFVPVTYTFHSPTQKSKSRACLLAMQGKALLKTAIRNSLNRVLFLI